MPDTTSQALSDDLISDIAAEHEVYALLPNLVAFVTAILAKQREMDAKAAPLPGAPFTTGTGEHWGREVRDRAGRGVAWCGQLGGQEMARMIANRLNARPPAAQDRDPLSEDDLLRAIQSIGPDGHGRIALTYESGPYGIDRPTNVAVRLCRAIERAIKEPQR